MEIARPQVSEKPPVAAKPRLRAAPPRPPKPPIASIVSPPSSSAQIAAQNDHEQSHSKESQTFRNSLPRRSHTSAVKPNHIISARANSDEVLSPSLENASSRSPEALQSSCLSPQRAGNLSPSSSASLPASFRKRNGNKANPHTPAALTTPIPFTPSSSKPPSLSQKPPIRHVAPPTPKQPPSSASHNIKHHFPSASKSTTSVVVENTKELKKDEKDTYVIHDKQPPNINLQKSASTETKSLHIKTVINSPPEAPTTPLRKNSITPPQRPTSPPSRCAISPEKTSKFPSKSSSPTTSTTPSEISTVHASEKDVITSDAKSQSERKLVAPPPLPKNPPRGGVPRKLRQSKLTPGYETSISREEVLEVPKSTEDGHHKISGNTEADSKVILNDDSQSSIVVINSQLEDNQGKDTSLVNDTSNAVVDTLSASQNDSASQKDSSGQNDSEGQNDSQNNSKTMPQPVKRNITESYVNNSNYRKPPKPRPRTRPSLTPNDIIIQQDSMSVYSNKSNENNPNQNYVAESAEADTFIEKKSENAEVNTEDSDGHICSEVEGHNLELEGDTSHKFEQSSFSLHQSIQNGEETSAISNNLLDHDQSNAFDHTTQNTEALSAMLQNSMSPGYADADTNIIHSDQPVEEVNVLLTGALINDSSLNLSSNEFVSDSETIKNTDDNTSDYKSVLQEEPETTCGMLKEIEELLRNKLGDIELDLNSSCVNNSLISSQDVEHTKQYPAVETGINHQDSFSIPRPDSLPSSSPVRPPRPKHQASITKHLGSMESLNDSIGGSSTECLTNVGLSKTTGLGTGKKMVPPKPKRNLPPRVSRSHSDVTGMKAIADNISPTSETAPQPLQEEIKPFLPPRLESLRRIEPSTSYQSPPPLPPRNKPQSSNLKDVGAEESDPPALPSRSSLLELRSNSMTELEVAENVEQSLSSKNTTQSGPQSVQSKPKVSSPARPRPARKAPPPPPGSPKRSATFSSGDNKQPDAGQSYIKMGTEQVPASPTVKRSNSAVHKQSCIDEEDHYHQISDTIRIREGIYFSSAHSQKSEAISHPAIPCSSCKTDSQDSQVPLESDNTPEDRSSVKLSGDIAKYIPAGSEAEIAKSPKVDMNAAHVNKSIPKEQKNLDWTTKNSLIKKMANGLGLGKSFKISKVPDITVMFDKSNKVTTNDSGKEKVSTRSIANVDSVADVKGSDLVNTISAQGDVEFDQNTTSSTETCPPARVDRPLSGISQQSTSSEQDESTQNMEEIVSSGTDTEPEEDKEEIYAVRKAKKVFFIAKEIVSSESTFVDVLKLLNLDFRFHISKTTENLGHPVIPSETLNKILDFLPQLQNFNEDLLKDLNERIENWETNPRLADIFVKKGPFLKLYSSYIRNFENAVAVLEDTTKKNSVFASALKEFELSPRCAKLALKHYMLKPIQRIPQYKLLLQDYLKQLNVGGLDYKDTFTALNIVSEVADHANDSMRHGDNVQKLLEVQRSLIGQFEVIQPGRVLVKQGELQKLSRKEMQPRMFFLFNDVLLYTTPVTSGYKINNILPLAGMKINFPKLEDYKFEFNIISVQRSFTLSVSSSQEKEQWVSALQTSIDENAKKHHTFQTSKQGPQTSLLDKDFVLGHKAPLWVPDTRVTMCMLCLLEFTLTWRRHHCRSCGRVVCSHCSENKAPLRYLKYEPARVCDTCFEKLRADMTSEYQHNQRARERWTSLSEEDSVTSVSEGTEEDTTDSYDGEGGVPDVIKHDSGLSLNHLMTRFQKIRVSNRDKRKPSNFRPSVLKEVHANDEGSDMCGYLRIYRSRKWKRLWFVVKGKVLYTYKASEDMAATESMPLLGYEVTRINSCFEGAEPDLLFELTHQNNQPLTTHKMGGKVSPSVGPGAEKTTQRLIFRTDSADATTKWLTVLREASLTYQ